MLTTHTLQLRVAALGCAIGVVMGIVGGLYSVSSSSALTAYNFGYYTSYDDVFRNYDFRSQWESQYNVDWAVTMLFWNNASVGKVTNSLWYYGYWANGGTMWARVTDNSVDWVWYGSEGKKMKVCDDYHMRIYADTHDSMLNNPGWGFFVFATTHRDRHEQGGCPGNVWHGLGEVAEEHFAQVFRNACNPVIDDAINMHNHENFRIEWVGSVPHYWENNQYATMVYIPAYYQPNNC